MSKRLSLNGHDATSVGATPTTPPDAVETSAPPVHGPKHHIAPNELGLNPETVIIQPPSPPPGLPSGRADENSVTKAELAEQLQVSSRTIDRWVDEGILPTPIRKGRGRMATRFQADAALLYWQEQGEEARKERRHRQRNRRNLPQGSLTHESRRRRSGR